MRFPENVRPVQINLVVELVALGIGPVERRMPCYHNEKDNCSSKKIHLSSIVWKPHDDFWSHVTESA